MLRFSLVFVLTLSSITARSKNNQQLLAEQNLKNEHDLLAKHTIINSIWFESNCLQIIKSMQFKQLNSCKLIDSDSINAYVLSHGSVYFTAAMMQQLRNKHQWASIIAHENAHLQLNHYLKLLQYLQNPSVFFPKSKLKKLLKKQEEQADKWAKDKLKQHGYDEKQIYFFLKRVSAIKNKKSYSHIRPSKRADKSPKNEIIDQEFIEKLKHIIQSQK